MNYEDWRRLKSPDEVEALRRDNARLRAALKPFAMKLDAWKNDAETPPLRKGQTHIEMSAAVSDLRRAKRAYQQQPNQDKAK